MPHVIVHFDPTKVDQDVVGQLKLKLQHIVAKAMSSPTRDIDQDPNEIYVRQQAAHPTDVNPAAIEIEIQAGRARGRNADGIVYWVIEGVIETQLIPPTIIDSEECCVWLRFSEDNGFRLFNPKHI